MRPSFVSALIGYFLLTAGTANATAFTITSPFGVDVTSVGATTVGGIVVDLVGTNGTHIVSELSASSLYIGFANANPFTVGTQSGFGTAVTNALGGGLAKAAFRFSLWDGDSAAGDFDFLQNSLLVNGISFGNWSNVNAENTDGFGNTLGLGMSGGGYRDETLDTGWFSSSDSNVMSSLFATITGTQALTFKVYDNTPGDNYYDFTQGVDGSLINVGQGPVVAATVPEPTTLALLGLGLIGLVSRRRRAEQAC